MDNEKNALDFGETNYLNDSDEGTFESWVEEGTEHETDGDILSDESFLDEEEEYTSKVDEEYEKENELVDDEGKDSDVGAADESFLDEEEEYKDAIDDNPIVDDNNIFNSDGEIEVMDKVGDAFTLKYIDIKDIIVTDRIRKNPSTMSLETSIRSTGLLQPLVVAPTSTDGLYVLISGYKRMVACAKNGIKRVPVIINSKVKTTDISILEAMYNHYSAYSVKEQIKYINYLENEKGILNQSTIEYLLQMENGDHPKLKDIMNDNDPNIVEDLLNGKFTIEQAYNKLKKKRQGQSKEEKEMQKAEGVYGDDKVEEIDGVGELGSDVALNDDEIKELGIDNAVDVEDKTLDELVQEGNDINGFEPEQQKVGERHTLDPALRKAVMARDDNTCQCCFEGGASYIDVNDAHHILPVYLGGKDEENNLICACVKCHKMIHLQSRGQLHLPKDMTEQEEPKFKKIVAYGNVIRKGMEKRGMKVDELKKVDNADKIGRQLPGKGDDID